MASSQAMKQSSLDLNLSTKKTRKQELLAQMDRVVPWAALIDVIAPYYPEGKNGRPPFALETMLRIHCMQQWFKPFLTPRSTGSLQGSMPMDECLTRAPF